MRHWLPGPWVTGTTRSFPHVAVAWRVPVFDVGQCRDTAWSFIVLLHRPPRIAYANATGRFRRPAAAVVTEAQLVISVAMIGCNETILMLTPGEAARLLRGALAVMGLAGCLDLPFNTTTCCVITTIGVVVRPVIRCLPLRSATHGNWAAFAVVVRTSFP